ncbi:hypothetical protein PAXRUDRAFT_8208 [Paxillus rubicundulus Ve08.2h10]|uniref:Uncharacterized protein n=1 Tax=Paxillus rubicundulus Ve08.2h10 TaxID=930991 RepID=A0A0D0DNK2_9AGAM|nr:hypothetical protein PAXRUDRAFT_8208 [Paxillus rubicundulus Ve08.2h10]
MPLLGTGTSTQKKGIRTMLTSPLRTSATILMATVLHATSLLGIKDIHKDILESLSSNHIASIHPKDTSDS